MEQNDQVEVHILVVLLIKHTKYMYVYPKELSSMIFPWRFYIIGVIVIGHWS